MKVWQLISQLTALNMPDADVVLRVDDNQDDIESITPAATAIDAPDGLVILEGMPD